MGTVVDSYDDCKGVAFAAQEKLRQFFERE